MVGYIQNYIDCLTGKSITDEENKRHFADMLKLEADKITPLVLECKAKGIDVNELCPELMQEWIEMIEALEVYHQSRIVYSPANRERLQYVLF